MVDKLRKYRIIYFIGDYWSSKGEKQMSMIIMARSESEAEWMFRHYYSNGKTNHLAGSKKSERRISCTTYITLIIVGSFIPV